MYIYMWLYNLAYIVFRTLAYYLSIYRAWLTASN